MGILSTLSTVFQKSSSESKSPQNPPDRISDDDIAKAKATHLPSLMSSWGISPQSSNNERYTYLSPFRAENNASFQVNYHAGKWTWRDWGTGEFGDAISLAEKYYEIDFLNAVRILTGKTSSIPHVSLPDLDKPPDTNPEKTDLERITWAREMHRKGMRSMPIDAATIEMYFTAKKVKYHKEMGTVLYFSQKDNIPYVGIPLPTPGRMVGMECRGLNQHVRKTFGKKVLWTLERDPARVLICESILDALAGETLLGDSNITLCSLNGVSNVELLEAYFRQLRPSKVTLSLDADEPGQKAQTRAMEIARGLDISIALIEEHKKEGVKDLHKLLMKRYDQ